MIFVPKIKSLKARISRNARFGEIYASVCIYGSTCDNECVKVLMHLKSLGFLFLETLAYFVLAWAIHYCSHPCEP